MNRSRPLAPPLLTVLLLAAAAHAADAPEAPHGIGATLASDFERLRVVSVVPGHGAARAGLAPGDVVVAAATSEGARRLTMLPVSEMRRLLAGPAGSRLALAVRRGRRTLFLSAERTFPLTAPGEPSAWNAIGLAGAYEGRAFRVASVAAGSPAAAAGFAAGDLLLAVGRAGKPHPAEWVEFTGTFAPAVVTVMRGGRKVRLPISIISKNRKR